MNRTSIKDRYRVDLVCDATGVRRPVPGLTSRAMAEQLADWIGRAGFVRAEVVEYVVTIDATERGAA